MNHVTLGGYYYPNEQQHSDKAHGFAVAVRTKKQGEWTNMFIQCTAFGKTIEFLESYSKGDPILLQGRIDVDKYQARDGSNRTSTKVIVDRIDFVPKPYEENRSQPKATRF